MDEKQPLLGNSGARSHGYPNNNPGAAHAQASTLPVGAMDSVAGYTNVDSSMLPPPANDEVMGQEPPQREAVTGLPQIGEDEARDALLQHVAEHCCYGSEAAKELCFTDLQHSSAFHYKLETFGEARATAWVYEPYSGQTVDGPHNGPAPGPWDIRVEPSKLFKNQKVDIDVPHTASIKPCHNCMGSGKMQCRACSGRGRIDCAPCCGTGHIANRDIGLGREKCPFCQGDSRIRCHSCCGSGFGKCTSCEGCRDLKCYIKLTVTWTNHIRDHIVERTALPDHLIRNVSGKVAFTEQQPRVWPINHFPDPEINTASQRIVQQHASAFPSERFLMQRHQVRVIPVTQARYKWKNDNSDFFVYGFEKKVHAPSYPQQCCCGCIVL